MRGVVILVVAVACGGKPAPSHDDASSRPIDAPVRVDLAPRPLGVADLAEFAWRKRPGQAAFRAARVAEHAEDWGKAVAKCREALAADPKHLEAAWLLAAGLAKLGKSPSEILPPLQLAAAGDFGKWGPASLELPALEPFLATPLGAAWKARVEADRATYATALGRAVIVVAGGDLYAFDVEGPRWYRVTRTGGVVIGALALRDQRLVAYVTRGKGGALSIGVVDLARGHTTKPVALGGSGPFEIAYGTKPAGIWIGAPRSPAWRIYADGKLVAAPARSTRPPGAWLEVSAKAVVALHRGKPRDVSADWDDQSLASAIKLGTSNRVVSVPSPGLIDGSTLVWSPDRAHLAFVAQLDDPCAQPRPTMTAAVFVAETATATIEEVERATGGLAVEWVSDRKLAVVGDKGVALVDLDHTRTPLGGASGLVTPRRLPRCAIPVPGDVTPEPIEPDDDPDVGDEAADANPR